MDHGKVFQTFQTVKQFGQIKFLSKVTVVLKSKSRSKKWSFTCDKLASVKRLGFLQTSSFCDGWPPLKGFAGLVDLCHLSQAGWSQSGLLFTPGKISRISSCRFRLWTLPLMALWYSEPQLYSVSIYFMSRFASPGFYAHFLISACADLMEESPLKYRRIKYCGLSLMRR